MKKSVTLRIVVVLFFLAPVQATGSAHELPIPSLVQEANTFAGSGTSGSQGVVHKTQTGGGQRTPPHLDVYCISGTMLVQIQNLGDQSYGMDEWAGTRGQAKRLEGFSIQLGPKAAGCGLSLEYMAHLQDLGDTPWVKEGGFVGTRNQSKRLEGFAIKLTGPNAANYEVFYQAHVQDLGGTPICKNGEFCGTKGQERRIEAIKVWIARSSTSLGVPDNVEISPEFRKVFLSIQQVDPPHPTNIDRGISVSFTVTNWTGQATSGTVIGFVDGFNVIRLFPHQLKAEGFPINELHSMSTVSGTLTTATGLTPGKHTLTLKYLVEGASSMAGPLGPIVRQDTIAEVSQDLEVTTLVIMVEDISPDLANGNHNHRYSTAGLTRALAGDQGILYAVSMNAGVWKSFAGGPWIQLPFSPPKAYSIAVDPNNPAHLAVGERNGDARTITLNESGVWESWDTGNTWAYIFNPLTEAACSSAQSQAIPAVAFSRRSTLFIATACGIGRKEVMEATFTFVPTAKGLGLVKALAASESKLWALTSSPSLFVSSDDGGHWDPTASIPLTATLQFNGPAGWGRGDDYSLAAFDSQAFLIAGEQKPDKSQNYTTVLTYQASTSQWTSQRVLDDLDGSGTGGRRFVKSFILGSQGEIGRDLQLFVSTAQAVYWANGQQGTTGPFNWVKLAATPAGGGRDLHDDMWDFHLAPNGKTAWIAGDGGVFENTFDLIQGWGTRNQGLHTHHVHDITVLQTGGVTRLAYASADNDAWYKDGTQDWKVADCCGDASWTAGDARGPALALLVRHAQMAVLTDFNSVNPIKLSNLKMEEFGAPLLLQVNQTLPAESPNPLLDVVRLENRPNDVYPTCGTPILLRTTTFSRNPSPYLQDNFDALNNPAWFVEADCLPAESSAFWVAGGHSAPQYYVYGNGQLFKRTGSGIPSTWQPLSVQNVLERSQYGPAFVNPYDPNHLFLLTADGIKVSVDGGQSFRTDDVLTALVTDSGKFPLQAGFTGGNGTDILQASNGSPMGTLSHMAFDSNTPHAVVAASPYTGVFYSKGDGVWRSLWSPHTSVSSVGIDAGSIYVATEGRGVVRIVGY